MAKLVRPDFDYLSSTAITLAVGSGVLLAACQALGPAPSEPTPVATANPCAAGAASAPCGPASPCNPCAAGAGGAPTGCTVPRLAQLSSVSPCATASPCSPCAAAGPCNPCAAANPCSPCAAANPCNPCAVASPCNPCAAANPCNPGAVASPCNPCAVANPCNPCAVASPCNPCAAANPCNPCAAAPPPPELTEAELVAAYDCVGGLLEAAYRNSGRATAAEYRRWARFSRTAYPAEAHGARFMNNYANAVASEGYGRWEAGDALPEGAILAKDSFIVAENGVISLGPLFVMEKRPSGYSAAARDWHYEMVMPDGAVRDDGMLQEFCNGCHRRAGAEDDHLMFLPLPYRIIGS